MNISQTENRITTLHAKADTLTRQLQTERLRNAKPRAAHERQRNLNVVTICNSSWLDTHTERFIRLARRAMPDANYTLVHVGDPADLAKSKTPDSFGHVLSIADDSTAPGYLHYNAIRYSLCSTLELDEVVYIDPDVDILQDISAISEDCTADIGWCRSPIEPAGFGDACRACGLNGDDPWSNSGTLVLRRDCSELYAEAAELLKVENFPPRMIGNMAFSVMLRRGGVKHCEIPYKYGSIWWDRERLSRALCVHYCNDQGKQRRLNLDAIWVS